jgi:hypothetical protein
MFGRERADALEATVEALEGQACPCRRNEPCPVIPQRIALRVITLGPGDPVSPSPQVMRDSA